MNKLAHLTETQSKSKSVSKTAFEPPHHLGIILDGNRRWAKEKKLPTIEGHYHGLQRIENIVREGFKLGVKIISLYIFSTENWRRTPKEVNYLMELFMNYFKQGSHRLLRSGFRLKFAGQINQPVNAEIRNAIHKIEKWSAKNKGPTVVLCFNYGGQIEILEMVKKIVKKGLQVDKINLKLLQKELYLPEVPNLDLIIRTSGEQRLSGFQLWRAAYSEILFVDQHWPDFTPLDLRQALKVYAQRNRRFGGN